MLRTVWPSGDRTRVLWAQQSTCFHARRRPPPRVLAFLRDAAGRNGVGHRLSEGSASEADGAFLPGRPLSVRKPLLTPSGPTHTSRVLASAAGPAAVGQRRPHSGAQRPPPRPTDFHEMFTLNGRAAGRRGVREAPAPRPRTPPAPGGQLRAPGPQWRGPSPDVFHDET